MSVCMLYRLEGLRIVERKIESLIGIFVAVCRRRLCSFCGHSDGQGSSVSRCWMRHVDILFLRISNFYLGNFSIQQRWDGQEKG